MNINRVGSGNININKAAEDKVAERAQSQRSKAIGQDKAREDAELKKVCEDFESIFVNMMFKSMRNTVPKSDTFGGEGGDMARETFQEMLDTELSNRISRGRGIGLADMMYKQLSKKNNKVEDNNA